jgi:ABC-2 type transport system permease protein
MSTQTPTPATAAPARKLARPEHAVSAEAGAAARPATARVASPAKACAALVLRSLSQSLKPLIAVGLVLMLLQVVLVLEASAQQQAHSFSRLAEMLPDFIRRTLGEMTLVAVSFQGAVCAGYFHPVVVLLVSFVSIYFGSEPAHDVEAGAVDLILARPLRRHWLVTRSLVLVVLSACAAPTMMALTMRVALQMLAPADAPWPAATQVLKMSVNLAAVASVMGAISLAIAARARRRGTPIAAAGVLTVLFYLVMFLEPTWRPAQTIGWLSPYHYFTPLNILAARGNPWRDVLVLVSAAAVLAAIAWQQFSQRDV